MKKTIYTFGVIAVVTLLAFNFSGCVDQDFEDISPVLDSTSIKANTTIAELKSIYPGKLFQLTDTTISKKDSIIIEGIVTSDDLTGNFYKQIFIEDATGGIEVRLNKTTLYNDYKRGQHVIVYCNDLYLGDYGGQIQLGSTYNNNGSIEISSLEGDVIINKHVFKKGKTLTPVNPMKMNPTLLTTTNIGRLVIFENMQIKDTLSLITGKTYTYADSKNKVTTNHILVSSSQVYEKLVLRTSGYSKFAGQTIATKNGSITGILTYYNGTFQLIVRDLTDINFTKPRH